MSSLPQSHDPKSARLPDTLSDRIVERVLNARLVLEKKAGSSRRDGGQRSAGLSRMADAEAAGALREIQSLKRVFRDLGHSYRQYRKETGGPVTPGLREAAYDFRANPSLPALIAVASYLDRLDLLS